MANYSFGDVDEIVCQHPTVGEVRYKPKANETATVDLGGIRTNDDANQVTSDGTLMSQKNRVRGSIELPVAVDNSLTQLTKTQALTQSPELGTWTISLLNGAVFKGKGVPVGDQQYDSNAGTMTLKVAFERLIEVLSATI